MDNSNSDKRVIVASQTYVGSLPLPDDLVKYNQARPNAEERIIAMAENEAKHRYDMEKMEEANRINVVRYSIISSTLCVLMLSVVIVYAIHEKATIAAIATAIGAIASVVGLFLYHKKKEES